MIETMSDQRIRPVRIDDAEKIYAMVGAMQNGVVYPVGPHWTLPQVQAECAALGWVLWGSEPADIEAFILYRDMGIAFEISFLGTAASVRGQGRMTDLLRYLLTHRPQDREIWLEVHERNEPARRLYEKIGFREVGKRPRYYADGGAAYLYNYG